MLIILTRVCTLYVKIQGADLPVLGGRAWSSYSRKWEALPSCNCGTGWWAAARGRTRPSRPWCSRRARCCCCLMAGIYTRFRSWENIKKYWGQFWLLFPGSCDSNRTPVSIYFLRLLVVALTHQSHLTWDQLTIANNDNFMMRYYFVLKTSLNWSFSLKGFFSIETLTCWVRIKKNYERQKRPQQAKTIFFR